MQGLAGACFHAQGRRVVVAEGAGGETQFLFQDVSVRPEKGKLVLFPPFWTHEHRAAELKSGAKYIATTWVIFA